MFRVAGRLDSLVAVDVADVIAEVLGGVGKDWGGDLVVGIGVGGAGEREGGHGAAASRVA